MPSQKNNSLQELLQQVESQHRQGKPFVIFRYPGEHSVKAFFQDHTQIHSPGNLDRSGFLINPFGDDLHAVFLIPDRTVEATFISGGYLAGEGADSQEPEHEKERYRNLISRTVGVIEGGNLKKVVLSRQFEVPTLKSVTEIFEAMNLSYPTAFCYCWYHPEAGCWAGATPETFLQISKGSFTTVALAGTLVRDEKGKPFWGSKELEEQQMVTDYIVSVLSAAGISVTRSPLKTIEAGNLWHLRTTISGKIKPANVPEIIRALHPTPAVCGVPLEDALQFIKKNEGYSRGYYTGYLGEIKVGREAEYRLYVNLRCMEYLGGRARVFVGGGITAGSDPAKEWEETRAKSRTILNIL